MSFAHDGTILLTGAAGFIGYHLAERLLREGCRVVGVDSLNDYYDPRLKQARLERLLGRPGFTFQQLDLADRAATPALFARTRPSGGGASRRPGRRALLAGEPARLCRRQPRRASLNVLEGCRHHGVAHLVYASTSSVYGANTKMPFSVHDNVDHPLSLYAATKKANELMAHTYSHLYRLPVTGLRFFTVYGPWGRPDMALFLFTKAMLAGRPIRVFNHGRMRRDFTYRRRHRRGRAPGDRPSCPRPTRTGAATQPDPGTSTAPYRLYNIGNHSPVELLHLIATLERALGVTAVKELLPMQPGDVPRDLRRHPGPHPRHRLHARDPDRGRRRALRALVPRGMAADRRVTAQAEVGRRSAASARRSTCGTTRCSALEPARCRRQERLGIDPSEAVGLPWIGPDRAIVQPTEYMDQLVLDQAAADIGAVGDRQQRQQGQLKPISSVRRRPAASATASPGRGWLQQVLVHSPPEWYFPCCRFCSSSRPVASRTITERARCSRPRWCPSSFGAVPTSLSTESDQDNPLQPVVHRSRSPDRPAGRRSLRQAQGYTLPIRVYDQALKASE